MQRHGLVWTYDEKKAAPGNKIVVGAAIALALILYVLRHWNDFE
jgi:hypothetical protein